MVEACETVTHCGHGSQGAATLTGQCNLRWNDFSGVAKLLFNGLRDNDALVSIDLSFSTVTDKDVETLAKEELKKQFRPVRSYTSKSIRILNFIN